MSQMFITADTHFGHRRIWQDFEREARPFSTQEEHDEALVWRWNSVVRKQDVVWHLGDFAIEGCKNATEILGRLTGRIKMVLGNHDGGRAREYMDAGVKVYGPTKMKGKVLFSHIPVHPDCLGTRFRVNVHGHLHSKVVMKQEITKIDEWDGQIWTEDVPDLRYINVSAEQNDLTPIPYETVRAMIRERGLNDG